MIIIEIESINNKQFKHTYSDLNLYIQKEGTEEVYSEAFDSVESTSTYIETDKPISYKGEKDLKLTRGDVFRGILLAKGITKDQIKNIILSMPEDTIEERAQKQIALIDFEDALHFYRRNPLIDKLGSMLGITVYQMTKFFETNDWRVLVSKGE